jgi:hypothetical protein
MRQLGADFTPGGPDPARSYSQAAVPTSSTSEGAAPCSIALAAHSPAVRVTALDLPAVIATTRRAVEAADLGDSFKYLLADM